MIAPPTDLNSRNFWQSDDARSISSALVSILSCSASTWLSDIDQGKEQIGIDWTLFRECRIDVSENAAIDPQPGTGQNMELKRHILNV